MRERAVALQPDIRVWQDSRMGNLWRVAYHDGGEEQVIVFPDSEAMGDFIAERLGLYLGDGDDLKTRPAA
jgi:hypothetical protein